MAISTQAQVVGTPSAVNFEGTVMVNGNPAPVGTIVDAFDPEGTHCGTYTVGIDDPSDPDVPGEYGYMPVYGDDTGDWSPQDEGALSGDIITFRIMSTEANIEQGDPTWTANFDFKTVDLSASLDIELEFSNRPSNEAGAPDMTIRFYSDIRNIGTVTDFYAVSVLSKQGWSTSAYNQIDYTSVGAERTVFFDVTVPSSPGVTRDTLIYDVYSQLDPSVRIQDTVLVLLTPSDIGDDPYGTLPNQFALRQNYPNPFNPTTTIAFNLPARSGVLLEVFDMLGRRVDALELGSMSAGEHNTEYDASALASGVYLYRITTEFASQAKKMVLTK